MHDMLREIFTGLPLWRKALVALGLVLLGLAWVVCWASYWVTDTFKGSK